MHFTFFVNYYIAQLYWLDITIFKPEKTRSRKTDTNTGHAASWFHLYIW